MLSSAATVCAPITAHNVTGSVSNLAAEGAAATSPVAGTSSHGTTTITSSISEQSRPLQNLAERFHGLTERLGGLGHSRTDSDSSSRTRTGTSLYSHPSIHPSA